jgi:hypothetical protein
MYNIPRMDKLMEENIDKFNWYPLLMMLIPNTFNTDQKLKT